MNVSRPAFRATNGGSSLSHRWAKDHKVTAATVTAPLAEGTALTNTALSTDEAEATVAQSGIMATIQDLLDSVSITSAVPHFAALMARTMNEKWETEATANLANFSNTTDNGTALTADDLLAAVTALEGRDVHGALRFIGHVKQAGDLRADITLTQVATYWANDRAAFQGSDVNSNMNGYAGTIFDVPIYKTSVVSKANANVSYAGAIIEDQEALGLLEKWNNKVELHRDTPRVATICVVSSAHGFAEIDDARGQGLYSDV